jgi:hypothetical protein
VAEPIGVLGDIDALQAKLDALKRHQAETAASPELPLAVLERPRRGELWIKKVHEPRPSKPNRYHLSKALLVSGSIYNTIECFR